MFSNIFKITNVYINRSQYFKRCINYSNIIYKKTILIVNVLVFKTTNVEE